jgi:hypothetical protein
MFPRLRDRLGTALDIVVEFSTLGEYSLDALPASTPAGAPPAEHEPRPGLGGAGFGGSLPATAGRVRIRRTVAGVATGVSPVANPAARRRRPGTPPAPEQPCLSADRR